MPDREVETNFVAELLAGTRAGQVVWTGTIRPGCYQFIPGEYLLAIADDGDGPVLVLHHRSGHRLHRFNALLTDGGDGRSEQSPLGELYGLAGEQALGLQRRLRQLTKQIASARAPVANSSGAAPQARDL